MVKLRITVHSRDVVQRCMQLPIRGHYNVLLVILIPMILEIVNYNAVKRFRAEII